MGYSCAQAANNSLDRLMEMLQKVGPCPRGTSNSWVHKGKHYFYEIDREKQSGAIEGDVYNFDTAESVGKFTIAANGEIKQFPGTDKVHRAMAGGMPPKGISGQVIYGEP